MNRSDGVRPGWVLPTIVIGQVLATSTWFAGNAVARELELLWDQGGSVGWVTLMVQLGFIVGTLVVAATGLADAMAGRRLFFIAAGLAAMSNACILLAPDSYPFVLACRFGTGLALAGVYPVGMKIAASWYGSGLGRALGYLVGALVLGTSLTHLVRGLEIGAHWQAALVASSAAALVGGLLVSFVPDGPHLKRAGANSFPWRQLSQAWASPAFRPAAMAYFGHMWELYTFWAFMPRWIQSLGLSTARTSLASFAVIAIGMLGCIAGGIVAERTSSRAVARFYLAVSGSCCLISPWMFGSAPTVMLVFLCIWGIAVVGDSPQLSSLTAQAAPRELVGSALTATTCIGFSITIVSLLMLETLSRVIDERYLFVPLAVGPIVGWYVLKRAKVCP